jgi:hypothetical protein
MLETSHITGLLDKVKSSMVDWWLQPAQFVAPFVKYEGSNFNEWLQRFVIFFYFFFFNFILK